MISLVLTLLAASPLAGQTMAGPAFEAFARDADRQCPSRMLRGITPGDLSWEQESFDERLSANQRDRLATANRQERICADSNGLACSTTQTLAAMRRTGLMSRFVEFSCAHSAPTAVVRDPPAAAAERPAVSSILPHLDLGSFANSTGPRRRPSLHTPADYGFTKQESFPDGWTELSEPDDGWHVSALLLDWEHGAATICFVDAGGRGASYRATQVLRISPAGSARWSAVQIGDRSDCRNDPPLH